MIAYHPDPVEVLNRGARTVWDRRRSAPTSSATLMPSPLTGPKVQPWASRALEDGSGPLSY